MTDTRTAQTEAQTAKEYNLHTPNSTPLSDAAQRLADALLTLNQVQDGYARERLGIAPDALPALVAELISQGWFIKRGAPVDMWCFRTGRWVKVPASHWALIKSPAGVRENGGLLHG